MHFPSQRTAAKAPWEAKILDEISGKSWKSLEKWKIIGKSLESIIPKIPRILQQDPLNRSRKQPEYLRSLATYLGVPLGFGPIQRLMEWCRFWPEKCDPKKPRCLCCSSWIFWLWKACYFGFFWKAIANRDGWWPPKKEMNMLQEQGHLYWNFRWWWKPMWSVLLTASPSSMCKGKGVR